MTKRIQATLKLLKKWTISSHLVPLCQNESLSYENEFEYHENEPLGVTHFNSQWPIFHLVTKIFTFQVMYLMHDDIRLEKVTTKP